MKTEESGLELPSSPSSNISTVQIINEELQNLGLDDTENPEVVESPSEEEEESGERSQCYPLRPGVPDCSFYLRTGACGFGSNCRFNHPLRKENKVCKDENGKEKSGQLECRYYLKLGGCKFGKACRYNHSREKVGEEEELELNFLGLPIRPGEKECPFYKRTGSCKFTTNCKFHHSDPTAVVGCDPPPGYPNGGTVGLHTSVVSQTPGKSWSLQRSSNEPITYMDASSPYVPMIPLPSGVHPDLEWNGYQVPVVSPLFPPEANVQPLPASVVSDLTKEADHSTQQQKMTVEEFPERPGQPDCQYFLRNGDCKFRSACRYHHPKTRLSKLPSCVTSPNGLPLRPDKIICTHYRRYGICKFGPACKFDHPMKCPLDSPTSPVVTAPAESPEDNPLMSKLDSVPIWGNRSEAINQQPQ